jgi:hypothetical protein
MRSSVPSLKSEAKVTAGPHPKMQISPRFFSVLSASFASLRGPERCVER